MKILVSGGAGFIGSHVVDAYLAAGHEVVVVDDLSTGRREHLNPGARFVKLDIRDRAARELVKAERPDVLNHHAAQMDVRRSVDDPVFDADVNIVGFLNLLEGARAVGVSRVLFASSGGAVYGEDENLPSAEGHPTRPLSPYGVSKLCGEHYLHCFRAAYGLTYVALRYGNVYGPRQDPHGEAGVVAIFCERLLRGQQATINGDGGQTRDYVFVGDVAAANVAALGTEYCGVLNIGTGKETDVNRLYELIRSEAASKAEAHNGPAKLGEQRRSVIDSRRAFDVLGWAPRVTLEEGIRRVVDFFREMGVEEARSSSGGAGAEGTKGR